MWPPFSLLCCCHGDLQHGGGKKWPEVVFAAVPVFATVNQGAECVSVILDGGL